MDGHGLGGSDIQHMVQVGDVADGQAQDLDLGELLVRREGGQQLPQLRKGHVEGFDADALPRGVGCPVLGRGTAPAPALLPAQVLQILLHSFSWLHPGWSAQTDSAGVLNAARVDTTAVAEDGFGLRVCRGQVELCLVRIEHHLCGRRADRRMDALGMRQDRLTQARHWSRAALLQ